MENKQKKHLIFWFSCFMLGIHDTRVKRRLGDLLAQPCANCEQRNPCTHTCTVTVWSRDHKAISSGKGPQGVYAPSYCEQQNQLWGQTRILRVLSRWAVKIPRIPQPLPVISSTPWLSCTSHTGKYIWHLRAVWEGKGNK